MKIEQMRIFVETAQAQSINQAAEKLYTSHQNLSATIKKMEDELKVRLEQSQKDYILKEKLKLLKEELGENDLKDDDITKLKEKIDTMVIPNNVRKRL